MFLFSSSPVHSLLSLPFWSTHSHPPIHLSSHLPLTTPQHLFIIHLYPPIHTTAPHSSHFQNPLFIYQSFLLIYFSLPFCTLTAHPHTVITIILISVPSYLHPHSSIWRWVTISFITETRLSLLYFSFSTPPKISSLTLLFQSHSVKGRSCY